MDYYLLTLRLVHIFTGVFWAGAIFLVVGFIMPAAKSLGPDGGKFMRRLFSTNSYPAVVNGMAALNVLSGLLLYDKVSMHFRMAWVHSPYGMAMSIGGVLAIIALLYGTVKLRPVAMKLAALGNKIEESGAPPTEEQQKEMGGYQMILGTGFRMVAYALIITVATMALGRYLN